LSIDSESGGKIVKNCWLIFGGEFIFGVTESTKRVPDKNASFSDGTITYDDQLDSDGFLHWKIGLVKILYFVKDKINSLFLKCIFVFIV